MPPFRVSTLSLAVLCCIIHTSVQLNSVDSYVAAVVEYAALGDTATDVPLDIIRRNWVNYELYMEQAASHNADIIVFPECGLTTMNIPSERNAIVPFLTPVPDPESNANPCQDTDPGVPEIIKNVSCAARRNQIYTVINLSEISPCDGLPDCPVDGAFFYNTNVAFDRNGTVVARYRKFNLFVEPGFDVTPTADLSTFDTDFGVRFGMFICFDILFHQPAIRLVQELGITDIAYPTAWFSELPYLTATQTQAAWAYAMDVNLLAAGFDNPSNGNSGSGIYAGKLGGLSIIMPITKISKLLINTVPKSTRYSSSQQGNQHESPTRGHHSTVATVSPPLALTGINVSTIGELTFFQNDFRSYTTLLIEGSDNGTRTTDVDLCHGEFCCHFYVTTERRSVAGLSQVFNTESQSEYHYRIGVFDGARNFAGVSMAGVQVCGVIPCRNKVDISTCGLALNATSTTGGLLFKSIDIRGSGFRHQKAVQMPSTLLDTVLPLPVDAFDFSTRQVAKDSVKVHLHTTKEISSLLGFAIYGRVYDRDGPMPSATLAS